MGSPQRAAARSSRHAVLLVVQVASLLAVAAIVYSLVLSGRVKLQGESGYSLLLLAILSHEVAVYLSSQRLRLFLAESRARISQLSIWRINLEAHFYYLAVPFGNDVARVMKLAALAPEVGWKRAIAAALADRVAGLLATLIFIVTVPIALGDRIDDAVAAVRDGTQGHSALLVLAAGFLAALAGAVFLALRHGLWRSLAMLQPLAAALPGGLLLSIVCMGLMVVSLLAFGQACGIAVTPLEAAAGLSVLLLSQVIPLALFGIGAGEAAAVGFYMLAGYSPGDAATLALGLYALRVVTGSIGGLLELLRYFKAV